MKRRVKSLIAVLAVCTVAAMTAMFTGCKLTDTIKDKIEHLKDSFTQTEAVSEWVLCTSADDLTVGDQVVIVVYSGEYALGAMQNASNRSAASVERDGNTVSFEDDVQIITLEAGVVDNTFAFNVGTGYLYASSSSSNQLKTHEMIDANSSWSITIDLNGMASIIAQGVSTNNRLFFNGTNNLFSCYASEQVPVMIYKFVKL